ncbi:MAG: SDR family oxidoreductase [Deltaproteobacteria bacterium]|nr:SDR family oxidoreductase [Deltaproteobacteria bacterium]
MTQQRTRSSIFVTGFPGFIGRRLVTQLATTRREASFHLLVQPRFAEEARRHVRALPRPERIEVLEGDVVDMHLGLAGGEYARLCDEVTEIWHLAAISYLGVPRETARRVNVEGTRNVLELARDCGELERLCHFSSAFVSGDRQGVVCEDELDAGQGFRSAYEETKYQAEKLVRRAAKALPVVIFRPAIVVGDSKTGEIDRLDGPYYLSVLLVTSPLAVPLPMPGDGVAPLHALPVDFLVDASIAIARDERSLGRTFHLVDPSPMSSRRIYEMIAEQVHRKVPRVSVPARAAEALLRMPFLEKLARPQRAALGYLNQMVFYNCQNTLELLDGTGLRCPPITSYLPKLVEFARAYYRKRREEKAGVEDPLDSPGQPGPASLR